MDYGEYVFNIYPNLYSDLTLSCVDLSAYAEAEEALNDYLRNWTLLWMCRITPDWCVTVHG